MDINEEGNPNITEEGFKAVLVGLRKLRVLGMPLLNVKILVISIE
jgi:hypothetical protein